jgi:hypothetical protein
MSDMHLLAESRLASYFEFLSFGTMKKYLASLALILGMAFYVAVQDYRASKYYAPERGNGGQSVATGHDEVHAKEHVYDPERDSPSWYGAFRWPNGTTTWALILTLIVIAEQTKETRRSVEITAKTLVTEFRPTVIVRSVKLDPPATEFYDRRGDGKWTIAIYLANTGGTEATVRKCEAWFQMYSREGNPMDTIWVNTFDQEFLLLPAGRHTLAGTLPDGDKFRQSLHSIESVVERNHVQMRYPTCHGTITYLDGNGFERKTGFFRQWNVGGQRFTVGDDPEHEYQD